MKIKNEKLTICYFLNRIHEINSPKIRHYNVLKSKLSDVLFEFSSFLSHIATESLQKNYREITEYHQHTSNKNLVGKPLHVHYVVFTRLQTPVAYWNACCLNHQVLLQGKFSRLKSKIKWRLISTCTRLIVIKRFNDSHLWF